MDLIPSFQVDHTKLVPVIYVSRVDTVGDSFVTTFDIRMKKPNLEPVIHPNAMHSIEHVVATYLRNEPKWKDQVVYWGPMGCCTGNYLLLKGDYQPADIVLLMIETFTFISEFEGDIPGANAHDCGNYMLNNLPMAKWEARKYLIEVLNNISQENMTYPED